MKILLIDDEKSALLNMTYILKKYSADFDIYSTQSPQEALQIAENENPELIFLDIQMPEMDGIDLAQILANKNRTIIFLTAYNDYAITAFNYGISDYLLKPLEYSRLKKSLDRIIPLIEKKSLNIKDNTNKTIQNNETSKKFIEIKTSSAACEVILEENIIYVTSFDGETTVYTKTKIISSDKRLIDIKNCLSKTTFIQPNRNYLCNIHYIKEISTEEEKNYILLKYNNSLIKVEVRKGIKKDIVQELKSKY